MANLNPSVSEFVLSPIERKQRHDIMGALSALQAAVLELKTQTERNQPNLRSREILIHSNRAIGTLETYVKKQFQIN
jgi:hypothetical protein